MATICKSRTYQLSIAANRWNEDDEANFSRAKAKRLPAEVLYDSIYFATGAIPEIPGVGKGVRASQLPDAQIDLKSGFLANLGRPVRESACECERSADMQMSAVMAFLSGPAISDAISAKDSELVRLTAEVKDDRKLIEEIYYRVLGRAPRPAEVDTALANLAAVAGTTKPFRACSRNGNLGGSRSKPNARKPDWKASPARQAHSTPISPNGPPRISKPKRIANSVSLPPRGIGGIRIDPSGPPHRLGSNLSSRSIADSLGSAEADESRLHVLGDRPQDPGRRGFAGLRNSAHAGPGHGLHP